MTKGSNPLKWMVSKVRWRNPGSVSLIGRQQRCIHWLHAGWTGKGSHQPVIYTVQVVNVHARQKSDRVPINKVHHTNDTPEGGKKKIYIRKKKSTIKILKLLLPHWKWKVMNYLLLDMFETNRLYYL